MTDQLIYALYVHNVIALEQLRASYPAHAALVQSYLERCGLWSDNYTNNMKQTYEDMADVSDGVPLAMKVPTGDENLGELFDFYDDSSILSENHLKPISKLEPPEKEDDDGSDT